MAEADKLIYFHVGTGKTGTKFLQYEVFPKLGNICYVQRTKYRKWNRIIPRLPCHRILASNEFDQQMERECRKLAANFPDSIPIIVFRQHGSYIASQYRRFVKNGHRFAFREFFDLENDAGYFKKSDLDYTRQIVLLKEIFRKEPLVFLYEDMKADPVKFVEKLAETIGASVKLSKINFNPRHRSYNEKQLKAVQFISYYINIRKRRVFKNSFLNLFWRLGLGAIRYGILYSANLLPENCFDKKPLIDPSELDSIDSYYKEDWKKVKEKAIRV